MTGINSRGYTKECYECGHAERYPLPTIKKKIIYLDQFVIDNFVKALDPKHPKHEKVIQDPFWLEAYKKLDVLSKAHLIVCPDSFYHQEESGPTTYFEDMQRMYEHLSGGVTFYSEEEIVQAQMEKHFLHFLQGKPTLFPTPDPSEIVIGELNEWHSHLRISINKKPQKEEVEKRIKQKEKGYQDFLNVFKRWQTERGKRFEDWYKEEHKGFVDGTILAISRFYQRRDEMVDKYVKTGEVDIDAMLPPPSLTLIESLKNMARREGCPTDEEALKKVLEYLNSQYLDLVPTLRIGTALYAVIAHQAANNNKKPPSPGVMVDVKMISGFLPYCDAMFVDDENTALLEDNRVKAKVQYPTKMFSRRNKEAFLQHLDDLLANADPEHLELIKKVYGEDYLKPYTQILEQKD